MPRTHGPFVTARLADRYRVDPAPALRDLERAGELVRGSCCPAAPSASGAIPRCCAASVARASPIFGARSRPRISASSRGFCPGGRTSTRIGPEAPGRTVSERRSSPPGRGAHARGVGARRAPRRLGAYSPAWLDELCTGGELVWIGAGALGRSGGRVALYFREDVRLAGPPPANAKLDSPRGRPRRDPRAARGEANLLGRPRIGAGSRDRGAPRGAVISRGRARSPTTRSRRCARGA